MHLVPGARGSVFKQIVSSRGRGRMRDAFRALLVTAASRLANYESFHAGPRSTVPGMRAGDVGVGLSVLYLPFDEFDLGPRYPGLPAPDYFPRIVRQLELVDRDIADNFADDAVVARSPAEMDAALAGGKLAILHCVEGGFHLGATPADVERAVAELASRGVAYITISHLVYRLVATNSNAIPFLPDFAYNLLFPQPAIGLTELGRAAVTAMVEHGVLVDLSHMSERAYADTFSLLDRLDPDRKVPLLASHVGYRFGHQDYNLTAQTIERIAERDGVIGLIFAEHQAADGLPHPHSFDDSIDLLCRHIDRIREVTGSHRHTAIGSDHDGFIKPTLPGLEDAGRMSALEPALRERYGDADADAISSGNALRALRAGWRGASS
jgi:microsomal dipeptidase-like Zn-dependent dipeptidase